MPKQHLRLLAPLALLIGLLTGHGLEAAPAPWYYWQHSSGGAPVCAQHAPGPGWTASSTPFAGPGCQRPLRRVTP
ncbi:MAG: hypothetical protein PHX60_06035 [Giesbergeria sp.]|uniref:hypothetical protein n=1 Tax=Giesbergeria sp. TaxID=2818473 RepID=UPI002634B588|nr:hypothetical protein [Giesbergeria sp.]MDD2609242.1 hypothetical protein [Giesbergeria sp.]